MRYHFLSLSVRIVFSKFGPIKIQLPVPPTAQCDIHLSRRSRPRSNSMSD